MNLLYFELPKTKKCILEGTFRTKKNKFCLLLLFYSYLHYFHFKEFNKNISSFISLFILSRTNYPIIQIFPMLFRGSVAKSKHGIIIGQNRRSKNKTFFKETNFIWHYSTGCFLIMIANFFYWFYIKNNASILYKPYLKITN